MNVWAHRVGIWSASSEKYNTVVPFWKLSELIVKLKNKEIGSKQISKLAIVAHGDTGGTVKLDRGDLTDENAKAYKKEFEDLMKYLSDNARIIFFSCIAGRGNGGDKLLNKLSGSYFPRKYVIGFTRVVRASATRQHPGVVGCTGDSLALKPCNPTSHQKDNLIDEYSIYSKWSYNGKIIKLAYDEAGIEEKKKVIIGAENVRKAIKASNAREIIDAIYSIKEPPFPKPLQKVWPFIMGELNKFRYFEYTQKQLDNLAEGNTRHEGIIAVYKKNAFTKYRCCPKCEGKKDFRHLCPELLKKYPNGPYK